MKMRLRFAGTDPVNIVNGHYPALETFLSPEEVLIRLTNFLKKNHYGYLQIDTQYGDLFGKKKDYELSFALSELEGKTLIEFHVYTPWRLFKAKKILKELYLDIVALFK